MPTDPTAAATDDHAMTDAPTACGGCSLRDALDAPAAMERREFLRAAGLALASLGLLGVGARKADAMPAPVGVLPPRAGDRPEERRYPLPAADGVSIDRDNSVIVARAAGKVYAFALSCPHQNTALRWNGDDHEFQCPKHKSHYRPDGIYVDGRATRDMDRLAIRRDGAALVVDVDTLYQSDLNPKEWAGAFVAAQ
jgi:nitrite reductase/ring-hydroxylating ferredoxin subunit